MHTIFLVNYSYQRQCLQAESLGLSVKRAFFKRNTFCGKICMHRLRGPLHSLPKYFLLQHDCGCRLWDEELEVSEEEKETKGSCYVSLTFLDLFCPDNYDISHQHIEESDESAEEHYPFPHKEKLPNLLSKSPHFSSQDYEQLHKHIPRRFWYHEPKQVPFSKSHFFSNCLRSFKQNMMERVTLHSILKQQILHQLC